MSRSPKHSLAEIERMILEKLENEQHEKRRREELRRKEEEKILQKKRLKEAIKRKENQLKVFLQNIESYRKTEGGQLVKNDIDSLIQNVKDLQSKVDLSTSIESINLKESSLKNSFATIKAQGETALLNKGLDQEEAELNSIEYSITSSNQSLAQRFDKEGLQRLETLLEDARDLLQKKQLQAARKKTALIKKELKEHQKRVQERHLDYLRKKGQAENLLSSTEDQLTVLKEDEVAMYWAEEEVENLKKRVHLAKEKMEKDDFTQVESICKEIKAQLGSLLDEANAKQLQEKKRQYILDGIMSVMEEMGFVIQEGSPELEDFSDPNSSMILHANRVGGGGISVSVPHEGDIWYDVDGFPMRVEEGSQGEEIHSCDEAEEQIEAMHRVMEESFGIKMSELTWEGKDPGRISKSADELPKDDQFHRRGGL